MRLYKKFLLTRNTTVSEKLPYKHGVSVLLLRDHNCCFYFKADYVYYK